MVRCAHERVRDDRCGISDQDRARDGKADVTLTKKRWLLGIALPNLGKRPITEITAADVLVPLRKVEALGNYETARRLRALIGQVFRYAIATSKASNDPTFGLKVH